jgi:hypothetical protein
MPEQIPGAIAMTERRSTWKLAAIVSLALTMLPLLAACTSGSSDQSTPLATPSTASDILQKASARLAETQTVRFKLDIQGETFIDSAHTIQLLSANGILVRPDRVKTDFKIKILRGVNVSTSLIIIGDQRWSTDLVTGEWGTAPPEFGYDPSVLFDGQKGIGPVMESITIMQLLDDESIGGRSCYHVQASVDPSVIKSVTNNTMQGNPIAVDLWIDRENYDLVRARLAEPSTVTGHEPATWTLDLSDQGADMHVDPPN